MNIEIEKYLITADKQNFTISEKYEKMDGKGPGAKPTGEFAYRDLCYPPSLESSFRKLLRYDLRDESVISIGSLLETIQRHTDYLETLYVDIKGVIEGGEFR